MYCPKCGTEHDPLSEFCMSCGFHIGRGDDTDSSHPEQPVPIALIVITWVLWVIEWIPLGQPVGYILSMSVLICTILLFNSKNSIGKANGWIMLIIWVISNIIAFFVAYHAASRLY
jgi:hypothetical protein